MSIWQLISSAKFSFITNEFVTDEYFDIKVNAINVPENIKNVKV